MFYDYIIEKNWASPYLARYTLTKLVDFPRQHLPSQPPPRRFAQVSRMAPRSACPKQKRGWLLLQKGVPNIAISMGTLTSSTNKYIMDLDVSKHGG